MTIVFLALAWVALIVWVVQLDSCDHENIRGVANYFDDDLQAFVHLKRCDDCDQTFITTER